MTWHDIAEETPKDFQRILVRLGDTIGTGIYLNGRYGIGLTQYAVLIGEPANLKLFTHWIAVEELL